MTENHIVGTVAEQFQTEGRVTSCAPYGAGHINRTFLVVCDSGKRYIFQKINNRVFSDIPALMSNIIAVTGHLASRNADPRACLHLVETRSGEKYLRDERGEYWRMYDFVEESLCLQSAESVNDFYESAVAFGSFQRQLADFPAESLYETIARFHHTPDRYRKFHEALAADPAGRAASCQDEIREYLKREKEAAVLQDQLERGVLPLRVTHNDTKLNNVLLDEHSRKALCVIDLDTVMPGLMAYDFGDSIRFGAATAAEDERDLRRVSMDLKLYRAYLRGFLSAAPAMSAAERISLPWGARLMTLECGLRFLTDYLEGDHYFAIHRPLHNLERSRTQLKMVMDMEEKWDSMLKILEEESGAISS